MTHTTHARTHATVRARWSWSARAGTFVSISPARVASRASRVASRANRAEARDGNALRVSRPHSSRRDGRRAVSRVVVRARARRDAVRARAIDGGRAREIAIKQSNHYPFDDADDDDTDDDDDAGGAYDARVGVRDERVSCARFGAGAGAGAGAWGGWYVARDDARTRRARGARDARTRARARRWARSWGWGW